MRGGLFVDLPVLELFVRFTTTVAATPRFEKLNFIKINRLFQVEDCVFDVENHFHALVNFNIEYLLAQLGILRRVLVDLLLTELFELLEFCVSWLPQKERHVIGN